MPESVPILTALYVAVGCLFANGCALVALSPGWRGQVAQAAATLVLTLIWPILAWHRTRAFLS
jgi:hypothetical protein